MLPCRLLSQTALRPPRCTDEMPMNLALFDLDHTLIPFDSGMAWTRFLVARGVLPPQAEPQYLAFCHQYVAGTLNIHDMHRASVTPLARFSRAQLAAWCLEFEAQMLSQVPAEMQALVRRHQDAGHLCALVTATTRFIAEPFGRLFGIDHVLATEAATQDGSQGGALTGEIDGQPCFREHKVSKVNAWLAARHMSLAGFDKSWFYSDSASDLPLLGAVSHPVAVQPDDRLRAHALAAGWPVLLRDA
jgi:HAD superfamily hydrolase (TIGR01490 family)